MKMPMNWVPLKKTGKNGLHAFSLCLEGDDEKLLEKLFVKFL